MTGQPTTADECVCDPVCDFCEHYDFNGDKDGAYRGLGMCRWPAHVMQMDPGDGCQDFDCKFCGKTGVR